MDRIKSMWTKQNFSGRNGLYWSKQEQIGPNMTEWTEQNQCGPNKNFEYLSFLSHLMAHISNF